MYTNDGIKKAVNGLKQAIEQANSKPLKEMKVCISSGNRKIGNTLNVSIPPVITCGNCSGCMRYCYDIKAVLQYANVRSARANNYSILTRSREKYFDDIVKALARRRKNKFFRWHVSGDIPDGGYLIYMVEIARMFPEFRFWTYTKRYDIVNQYVREHGGNRDCIPSNLSIMFSEWRGMPMVNPFGFPEFRVVMKGEEKPENVKWCCGNCNVCIHANSHCVKGETVYCMEH